MNNLLSAIMTKFTSSAISSDVGGRIYLDRAPEKSPFPYIVFSVDAGPPQRTFTEHWEDRSIQFSLYSKSKSATEITTMYADIDALFDECALTITGSTLVWMRRANTTTMIDDVTTPDGTFSLKHWAVEYDILTSLN